MSTKTQPPLMGEPTDDQVNLSKEELEKRRVEITTYYKDNIKHLKIQLEYEELLRDIEKVRAERVQAQMYLAQAMAPPPEGDPSGASQSEIDFRAMQEEAKAQGGADFDVDTQKRTLKRTPQ
jgi:hypothetical protein